MKIKLNKYFIYFKHLVLYFIFIKNKFNYTTAVINTFYIFEFFSIIGTFVAQYPGNIM